MGGSRELLKFSESHFLHLCLTIPSFVNLSLFLAFVLNQVSHSKVLSIWISVLLIIALTVKFIFCVYHCNEIVQLLFLGGKRGGAEERKKRYPFSKELLSTYDAPGLS